jgi:hypothetical protein
MLIYIGFGMIILADDGELLGAIVLSLSFKP